MGVDVARLRAVSEAREAASADEEEAAAAALDDEAAATESRTVVWTAVKMVWGISLPSRVLSLRMITQ